MFRVFVGPGYGVRPRRAPAGVPGGGGAVRLLVVLVVTVALLAAAAPLAVTQAPRLHSPLLAVVAFGVAGIAFVAGVALLVRATRLGRRAVDDGPPPDEAVTDPTPGPEHIVLVPTAGRITVSTGASATGPRHALAEAPDAGPGSGRVPRQARQDPSTAGQSPTGPSQTHAQQTWADRRRGHPRPRRRPGPRGRRGGRCPVRVVRRPVHDDALAAVVRPLVGVQRREPRLRVVELDDVAPGEDAGRVADERGVAAAGVVHPARRHGGPGAARGRGEPPPGRGAGLQGPVDEHPGRPGPRVGGAGGDDGGRVGGDLARDADAGRGPRPGARPGTGRATRRRAAGPGSPRRASRRAPGRAGRRRRGRRRGRRAPRRARSAGRVPRRRRGPRPAPGSRATRRGSPGARRRRPARASPGAPRRGPASRPPRPPPPRSPRPAARRRARPARARGAAR